MSEPHDENGLSRDDLAGELEPTDEPGVAVETPVVPPPERRGRGRWARRGAVTVALVALLLLVWGWGPLPPRTVLASMAGRLHAARAVSAQWRLTVEVGSGGTALTVRADLDTIGAKDGRARCDVQVDGEKVARVWSDGKLGTVELVPMRQAVQFPWPKDWRDCAALADLPGAEGMKAAFDRGHQNAQAAGQLLQEAKAVWGLDSADEWLRSLPPIAQARPMTVRHDQFAFVIWVDRWTHLPRRLAVPAKTWRALIEAHTKGAGQPGEQARQMTEALGAFQANLCVDWPRLQLNQRLPADAFTPKLGAGVELLKADTYGEAMKQLLERACPGLGGSVRPGRT